MYDNGTGLIDNASASESERGHLSKPWIGPTNHWPVSLIVNFFIRMPWSYVPCSAKANKKQLYENEKMFYRNFRKYWWVLLIIIR